MAKAPNKTAAKRGPIVAKTNPASASDASDLPPTDNSLPAEGTDAEIGGDGEGAGEGDLGAHDETPAYMLEHDAAEQAATDHARAAIAAKFASLMGDQPDADGIAADVIDAGASQMLWGVKPSADVIAIIPEMADLTDPRQWLAGLDEADFPGDLEAAFEKLCRPLISRMDGQGEDQTRQQFLARAGDLLRSASIECVALRRRRGGYDWIAMNQADVANETDGEPWRPPGGMLSADDMKRLGHALGMGGIVYLWPEGGAAMPTRLAPLNFAPGAQDVAPPAPVGQPLPVPVAAPAPPAAPAPGPPAGAPVAATPMPADSGAA